MKQVTRIQTFDGAEHVSKQKAITHLENIQGAIITKHAHKLASITKYADIIAYLVDNFMDFEGAIIAEKDRVLYCSDDD